MPVRQTWGGRLGWIVGVLLAAACGPAPRAPLVIDTPGPPARDHTLNVRQPFDFRALPTTSNVEPAAAGASFAVSCQGGSNGSIAEPTQTVRCELGGGQLLGNLQLGRFNGWTDESKPAANPCRLTLPSLPARAFGIDAKSWTKHSLVELELEGSVATDSCSGEANTTRRTTAEAILGGLVYAYRRERGSQRPQQLVLWMPWASWVVADAEPSSEIVLDRGPVSRVALPVQPGTSSSLLASVPIRVARAWLARSGRALRYPSNAAELSLDVAIEVSWGHGEDAPLAMATATLFDDGRRVDALRWVEDS